MIQTTASNCTLNLLFSHNYLKITELLLKCNTSQPVLGQFGQICINRLPPRGTKYVVPLGIKRRTTCFLVSSRAC